MDDIAKKGRSRTTVRTETVELLSALSNLIRLEVLTSLGRAEKSVHEIAKELELDESTISHALQRLRSAKLVDHSEAQKRRIYRLSEAVTARADMQVVTLDFSPGVGGRLTIESAMSHQRRE